MALPGLDTGRALRSMRLFAEEIAPGMVPAEPVERGRPHMSMPPLTPQTCPVM